MTETSYLFPKGIPDSNELIKHKTYRACHHTFKKDSDLPSGG